MKKINPLELYFWTFRRKEKDIINLYDSLSDLMKLATGSDMLNFGFWNDETSSPISAQKNLCTIFGKIAQLKSKQNIVDVGSGFASPALQWYNDYNPIKVNCVNINFKQLKDSIKNISKTFSNEHKNKNYKKNFNFINATATILPFENESFDRVLALESSQHLKPLKNFFSESYRILKKKGMLSLALPIMTERPTVPILKLGILSMTWLSEHYSLNFVESLLKQEGFHIIEIQKIGSNVYEPSATYYIKNREFLKTRILKQYPSYVEKILFKSLNKMRDISQKKIIDYLLVNCQK